MTDKKPPSWSLSSSKKDDNKENMRVSTWLYTDQFSKAPGASNSLNWVRNKDGLHGRGTHAKDS